MQYMKEVNPQQFIIIMEVELLVIQQRVEKQQDYVMEQVIK